MAEHGFNAFDSRATPSVKENGVPVVNRVTFPSLPDAPAGPSQHGIPAVFHAVALALQAELGKTMLKVRDLINLEQGSLLKLDRLADESIAVLVNEVPFAQGEVVVINDRFAVRITAFDGEA